MQRHWNAENNPFIFRRVGGGIAELGSLRLMGREERRRRKREREGEETR
jgi:hypothetical protein